MSWITLEAADLQKRLGQVRTTAVADAALAEQRADPWTDLLADAINHARGQIGSHPRNTLGPEGTIPEAAKRHVISIAVWDALTTFSLTTLLGTSKDDYDRAESYLKSIARGEITVEQPEAAGTEEFRNREGAFATADVELSTKRRATRDRLDGLG